MANRKPPVLFYSEEAVKYYENKKATTPKDFLQFQLTDPNDATIVTKAS